MFLFHSLSHFNLIEISDDDGNDDDDDGDDEDDNDDHDVDIDDDNGLIFVKHMIIIFFFLSQIFNLQYQVSVFICFGFCLQ